MIYKYENQDQIPKQLLCCVCVSICENPLQCIQCDQIICYICIQSPDCCTCKKEKYSPVGGLINYFMEMVQCKCQYCSKYKKYLKFRNHLNRCKVIHTDLSNYFFILEKYSDDNKISLNQDSAIQDVDSCICIQQLKTQEKKIENKDLQLKNEIKLNCKYCNLIIQFVNAKDHYKQCLEINKVEQSYCNSELNHEDFFSLYKYSLKQFTKNARDSSNIRFKQFKIQAEFYMNELDKQRLRFQQKKLWKKQNFI